MSRINTNVPALTAIHNLTANTKSVNRSLERLSSGLRINRGSDDPAGLIASESLRSEIRGINAAIANSERAINVVSTADAALAEVSKLLLDIKGLIVQTANDGALSQDEIEANQQQIDALLTSIDRIANSTQFNGKKLLNGNLGYHIEGQDETNLARLQVFGARVPDSASLPVDVAVTQSALVAQLNIDVGGTGVDAGGLLSAGNNITLEVQGLLGTEVYNFASGTSIQSIASAITNNASLTGVSAVASAGGLAFISSGFGSRQFVSVDVISGTFDLHDETGTARERDIGQDAQVFINGQQASVDGLRASLRSAGLDVVIDLTESFGTAIGSDTFSVTGGGANFQIGPDVNSNGRISMGIESISSTHLGTSEDGFLFALGTGRDTQVLNSVNHPRAQEIVDAAIIQVSRMSGRLGAFQANQVETNLNSLRVALENVTASESAIRDTDYSVEVSNLTRAQILLQSTTQILGIANSIPQNVLSLLG